MNQLQITKESKTKNGKSRQFAAIYLSSIRADMLWDGGRTDTGKVERPVYLAVAGPETTLRPFLANLRLGRRADVLSPERPSWDDTTAVQMLKSVNYDTAVQRHGDVTVCQFMHPDVWPVDPGMVDPDTVAFLSVAPVWWHERQMAALADDRAMTGRLLAHAHRAGLATQPRRGEPLSDDDMLDFAPDAARFVQYLDRRTRRPIPNDPAFYLQLYLGALAEGIASRSKAHQYRTAHSWAFHHWAMGFDEFNTAALGLRPGTVFSATVDRTDEFLARQVRLYTEAQDGTA